MLEVYYVTPVNTGVIQGGTLGNGVPIVEKLSKRTEPLLKCFKNALWTAWRTIFRHILHYIAGFFLYILSQKFSGVIPQTPVERPGAWIHTPISAGLS